MSGVKVVAPGEGRPWWWLGTVVRWLATGDDTDQRYILREEPVTAGGDPAPRIQHREEACYYVLDGGPLAFTAGDRSLQLPAGSFVNVSKGTAHLVETAGENEARVLIGCFPAGFERFQFAAGEAIDDPEAPRAATDEDRRRVLEIAPEFGVEMNPGPEAFAAPPAIRVVPAGTGEATPIAGDLWTALAEGRHTDGAFSMYAVAVAPGEGAPPMHHDDVDVGCYVVSGTLRIDAGKEVVEGKPGTFVHVPAGTEHRLLAGGEMPGRVLLWATPAADLITLAAPP